jgi:hypothetical protein
MTITDYILVPPPNIRGTQDDSDVNYLLFLVKQKYNRLKEQVCNTP